MDYHRGFGDYRKLFNEGKIRVGDVISVKSIYSKVERRDYVVVNSEDGRTKHQLEDSFGRVTTSRILHMDRIWSVSNSTRKL